MLNSDLLKSKIPIFRGGGLRNLMLSSDLLKSKIPICVCVWGGGGVGGTNFQLLMLSPNLLTKIILKNL